MPFDPTPARVTILPPSPPPRGEGPQLPRIHIEIEIVDRRKPPSRRAGSWWLAAWIWLLVLLILASVGHAQSWSSWTSSGGITYLDGPDGWRGTSFRTQGSNTRYTDLIGPNGQTRHCTSFRFHDSSTIRTDCTP